MLRAREISARELLDAHLDRIERLNPGAQRRRDPRRRGRAGSGRRRRRRAGGRRGGRPAARAAGRAQGHPRHRRHADDVGLAAAHRHRAAARRADRGPATRPPAPCGSGKTNVPEFAAGSHTFNPVFGATHNPYRHGLSAGGSSGGAAAALAAGLRAAGRRQRHGRLAAQPGRLLQRRRPAAHARAGCRPGRRPMGWSQLSVQGPMGRTVADVALQLSVLAGPDPRVPISLADDPAGFAAPLPVVAGRPPGGVGAGPRRPGDRSTRRSPRCWRRPRRSSRRSARRSRRPAPTCPAPTRSSGRCGPGCSRPRSASSARRHPDKVKESIRWNAELGAKLTGADLARAEIAHTTLYERMVAFFERYDVLLAPTTQVLPFPVELEYPTEIAGVPQENYLEWMRSCTLISATGCPALSVPGGFTDDGLPVGLQVIGAPRADRRRARGRPRLRAGHAVRRAPSRPLRKDPLPPRLASSQRDPAEGPILSVGLAVSSAAGRRYYLSGRGRRRAARRLRRPRSVRTATSSSASSCRSPAEMSASCAAARLGGVPALDPGRDELLRRVGVRGPQGQDVLGERACSMARSSRSEARAIDGQRRSRGSAMISSRSGTSAEPLAPGTGRPARSAARAPRSAR